MLLLNSFRTSFEYNLKSIRLSLLLLFVLNSVCSQSNYKFYELGENEGLTNSTIHTIVQDSIGFHWVGTEDGLFRFDGTTFEAFYEIGSRNTIPGSTVNKILVDQKNRVWILTNKGVGLYDYQTDRIIHLLNNDLDLRPEERVFNAISQTKDGAIFLGNSYGGIYKVPVIESTSNYSGKDITKIIQLDHEISDFELKYDNLWIGTWHDGVLKLNLNTYAIRYPESSLDNNEMLSIYDVYKDAGGIIYIGTSHGLKTIDTDGQRFYIANSDIQIEDEVLSILSDSNGDLWLGTRNQGLFKYNLDVNGYHIQDKHFSAGISTKTISYRTISFVFQDINKQIWLGTHGKGLNIFNSEGERFNTIIPPMKDLISGDNITSVWGIAQTDDTGIWFSTDGAGLYYYDYDSDIAEKIASTSGPILIDDNAVLSIAAENKNTLWLGTYSQGIHILDIESKKVRKICKSTPGHDLQSNDIRSFHMDKNDEIWIGTNRGGLHYYDKEQDKINSISNTINLDIRAIIDDPVDSSVLWLATYGDGLVRYNKTDNSIINYNWNTENKKEIPIALCITYSHNRIWIGTKDSGIQYFDLQSNSFKSFEIEGELLSNTVKAILPVGKHLWISTNRGLSVLNVESRKLANYTSMDGLKLSQFNDSSALLTKNGDFVFGSIHGLSILNPESVLSNASLPKLVFSSLDYNNEPIQPDDGKGVLTSALTVATELNFKPDMDNFSIYFGVLDFIPSPSFEYIYYLENYDKDWNITKNRNAATYRNLPPGNYVFKARVYDISNGNEGPLNTINISVLPPWWQTYWAYAGFSAILIFLLIVGYRINKTRIKQKERLYYDQKLQAKEVSSMEEKMRFYTNFSHELRTPITLILGPVNELLKNKQIPDSYKSSLNLVKRNATTLLKLINRFLDFRKIDTENSQLSLGKYDLSALAIEEAESFEYLAKERGIEFDFYYESDLECWVDIEKIQIILNNLLSNALKFTNTGKKVSFKAYKKNGDIIFKVKDSGVGIDTNELQSIFQPFYQAKNSNSTGGSGLGLSISKSFVEMHGGKLSVKSEVGKGSTFKFWIPQGKEHFNNQENVKYTKLKKGELSVENEKEQIGEEELVQASNENVLLIVDDNEDIRNYIGTLFSDRFTLLFAENGHKALKVARKTSPDVIISDLMMPEMNGHEFCKQIKDNITTSHIPVIILTAKSARDAQLTSFEIGADAYVTKPFDSEILISRVDNLLRSRKELKKRFEVQTWDIPEQSNSTEVEFLRRIEDKVLELLPKGNLTVPELCKEVGFSRTSLYRKIKALTDLSINQFIRSIKLKKAAEMLVQEEMNVSEVAFALDFTDLKYFRNEFKKQYGIMPSEHIKTHKPKKTINPSELKKELKLE